MTETALQWLDIDDLVRWCRETDNENNRAVLTYIGTAVELVIEEHLARPLFASQGDLDAVDPTPEHAMVVNEPIRQAARMLVSHLNENRESASDLALNDVPFGYLYLLQDYRIRSNP